MKVLTPVLLIYFMSNAAHADLAGYLDESVKLLSQAMLSLKVSPENVETLITLSFEHNIEVDSNTNEYLRYTSIVDGYGGKFIAGSRTLILNPINAGPSMNCEKTVSYGLQVCRSENADSLNKVNNFEVKFLLGRTEMEQIKAAQHPLTGGRPFTVEEELHYLESTENLAWIKTQVNLADLIDHYRHKWPRGRPFSMDSSGAKKQLHITIGLYNSGNYMINRVDFDWQRHYQTKPWN